MFRSIVALIEPTGDPTGFAREAGALADRTGARLTLFAAAPTVRTCSPVFWAATPAAPETPFSLQQACDCECEALLRRAAQAVPEAVPVTMTVRRGRAYASLHQEVDAAGHDLVILDGAQAGGLRRAAQLRFGRRCDAPVLRLRVTSRPGRRRRSGWPQGLEAVRAAIPAPHPSQHRPAA
jgi:hypothetical protein